MFADNGTNTKIYKKGFKKESFFTCYILQVACYMSLKPTATATNPPLLTHPLCTEGWFAKTQKHKENFLKDKKSFKRQKTKKNIQRYANIGETLFDPVHQEREFPNHCCLVVHINVLQQQNIFCSRMNRPSDDSSRRIIPVQIWELLHTFKYFFQIKKFETIFCFFWGRGNFEIFF